MDSGCINILVLRPSGEEVQINTASLEYVRDLKTRIVEGLQFPRLCVELAAGEHRLLDDEKLPTAIPPSPCIVTLTISAQQAINRLQTDGTPDREALEAVEALRYIAYAEGDCTFQGLCNCLDPDRGFKLHAAALGALVDLACCGHVNAAVFVQRHLTSLSDLLNNRAVDAVDEFCAIAPWDWKDPTLAKNVYEAFTADQDVRVRHAAVRLVAKTVTKGDDQAISILQSRLECQTEDTLVRRMAAGALRRVALEGHNSAAAAIRSRACDQDTVIRGAALKFNQSHSQGNTNDQGGTNNNGRKRDSASASCE
mmetsp:Transcript_7683/g.14352  ORF Transcript_7683/g.14352 Transcript_7683/m.14352 type:complete len:311 (-) Transcript_7683:139-1071(-)